jgi:hypothetical protein
MKNACILILVLMLFSAKFTFAQNNLPYLGQNPPGMTAKRFPPDSLLGNNSWWWHGSPIFTADGLEMFWTEYVRYAPTIEMATLFNMKVENNAWGPVSYPSFGNQNYFENNPLLTAGGDTLYFLSTKPGGLFYMTTRTATGWSQPSPVYIPIPPGCGIGLQFAVNRGGDFYIEVSNPPSAPSDIYISRLVNGNYQMAEKLGPEINSDSLDAFPFVDPDEEYLIFASNRPGGYGGQFDCYICFKNSNLTWTDAVNMGHEINSAGAWFATVTQDKQYLFFNSWKPGDQGYNPYWISAAIIDSLRTLVGLKEPMKSPVGTILHQNSPNPFFDQTLISFELDSPAKISFDILNEMGVPVQTFAPQLYQSGKHSIQFEGTGLNPGVYFYVLKSECGTTMAKKMILSRHND